MQGFLTTIIGAVGSGKSTLLLMILGELPCNQGSLSVSGTVSYASQEPWLFVGNFKLQNPPPMSACLEIGKTAF